jgi:succinylglutamic semialdehyde dehydrogenase
MKYLGDYIHGRFVRPNQEVQGILSEDPGDLSNPVGEVLFSIKQVSLAVEAARAAFSSWSQLSFKKRVFFIRQFQSRCSKKKNELANLISREMGKPLQESIAEVDRIIAKIDISIKEEPKLVSKSQHAVGSELTGKYQFRPRGVLAILSPFNVPAYLASAQIIPALMFGNTVVLKPSEITPFVGQFLAQLWDESEQMPKLKKDMLSTLMVSKLVLELIRNKLLFV